MKQSSLDIFLNELNQLRQYLQHIQIVNEFVGYTPLETDSKEVKELIERLKNQEIDNNFILERKIFEYKAIVISLYGTLERTIENWVREFLDALSGIITDYTKLPDKIKDNHFKNSLELITDKLSKKDIAPKYQHLRKEGVLKTLNQCVEQGANYKFNTDAFLLSSGNLKHDKIYPILLSLDIDLKQKNFMKGKSENDKKAIFSKLDDFIERRNEVAHGSDNVVDNILEASLIEEHIANIEVYGSAIFDILNQRLIRFEAEDSGAFFLVEVIHGVWKKDVIRIGMELEKYTISVGDLLLIRTPEGEYLKEKIIGIGVEGETYTTLSIKEKMNVALVIESYISSKKESHKFYLKNNQK